MTKNICVLGSGMVSSCVLSYLCGESKLDSHPDYSITVASNMPYQLDALQKLYPKIMTRNLDVTVDALQLKNLIESSDIVISLLLNSMQTTIVKICVELKVDMIHASYCTPEMTALDQSAKQNGVVILTEMGLDPGIDHFLAMKCFHELQAEPGTKITGYISYCGGLPEPKVAAQNPLRYKFSWSPLTALKNLLNAAKYMRENRIVEISAGGSLIDAIEDSSDVFPSEKTAFESYPNRDSLVYKELYGLQDASTIIRGTYRYKGFKNTVKTLFRLGLFSVRPTSEMVDIELIKSWEDLLRRLITNDGSNDQLDALFKKNGYTSEEVQCLNDLGLTNKQPVDIQPTLMETLATHLSTLLQLESNERDVVFMRHEIHYERNGVKGKREISLVAFGEQDKHGFSAMSKTVALPLVLGVKLILEGCVKQIGVIHPFTPDIYRPILDELCKQGFQFVETDSTIETTKL